MGVWGWMSTDRRLMTHVFYGRCALVADRIRQTVSGVTTEVGAQCSSVATQRCGWRAARQQHGPVWKQRDNNHGFRSGFPVACQQAGPAQRESLSKLQVPLSKRCECLVPPLFGSRPDPSASRLSAPTQTEGLGQVPVPLGQSVQCHRPFQRLLRLNNRASRPSHSVVLGQVTVRIGSSASRASHS